MGCRALLVASLGATLVLVSSPAGAARVDGTSIFGPHGRQSRAIIVASLDSSPSASSQQARAQRRDRVADSANQSGRRAVRRGQRATPGTGKARQQRQAEQPRRAAPNRRTVERTAPRQPLPRRGGRNVTSIGIDAGRLYFYYGPGRYSRYAGYRYPVYNRVRVGTDFRYRSGFKYGHPNGYGYAFRFGYGYGYWPYYPIYSYGANVTTYDWYPDLGAVRLQVRPRHADVFVDGYFAGTVDDFDGTFQRLRLGAGPHQIEIHADGYEPFYLDVYVRPGETIKYEGSLQRLPQKMGSDPDRCAEGGSSVRAGSSSSF